MQKFSSLKFSLETRVGNKYYTVSALSEAYQILSESSRLSFQIFSQSPATKLKVLYNQNSSELYQLPSELANKNHQRRFQI